ncbi:hypothetical protein M747DRAFT_136893 [Aspergillus niger ATCC 13496]|uniref:Uncharacterized protein n=1 Tax=Aspergillus niger ATCC 13496 TaxID=1353008 RepID=A0A370CE21_ASPNG|nr:hypothetical protein M747DRAFT_136893 [Aspergillus niger ATCC 13496]
MKWYTHSHTTHYLLCTVYTTCRRTSCNSNASNCNCLTCLIARASRSLRLIGTALIHTFLFLQSRATPVRCCTLILFLPARDLDQHVIT